MESKLLCDLMKKREVDPANHCGDGTFSKFLLFLLIPMPINLVKIHFFPSFSTNSGREISPFSF